MANSCVSASNQGMIDQGSINWYQSSHDLDIGARNWQSVDIYGGLGASRAVPKELQPWQRADPSPHEWQPWQGYGGHSGTGTWQASPHERSSSTNGKIPQHKDSIDRMIDKFDHINSRLELVLKELGRQREEIESQLCRKVFPPNSCMNPNPNTLISSPMDYKNPSQLNLSNVHDMSFPLSHTGSNPYQDSYVSHSSSIPRTQQEYQCYSDPNLGHNLENNTGNSCHQPSSYPGPGSIPAQSTPDLHPQISTLSVHPQSGNWSVHDGLVPSRSATIEWQRDNDNGEAIFSEEETISTIHPTTNGKGNREDATPDVNEVDKNIFPVSTTNCFALLTKPELLSDEQAWHCECSFENVGSLDDPGAVENTSGFRFSHSQVVYIVWDPGSKLQLECKGGFIMARKCTCLVDDLSLELVAHTWRAMKLKLSLYNSTNLHSFVWDPGKSILLVLQTLNSREHQVTAFFSIESIEFTIICISWRHSDSLTHKEDCHPKRRLEEFMITLWDPGITSWENFTGLAPKSQAKSIC